MDLHLIRKSSLFHAQRMMEVIFSLVEPTQSIEETRQKQFIRMVNNISYKRYKSLKMTTMYNFDMIVVVNVTFNLINYDL